jgi:hypothetical protein
MNYKKFMKITSLVINRSAGGGGSGGKLLPPQFL